MNIEEATMKALNGKLEETKVGYQAGICPKCGADIQDYEEVEWFDDSIGYPFHCTKCGADGMEYYSLTFDEVVLNDDFGKTEENIEPKEEFLDPNITIAPSVDLGDGAGLGMLAGML